MPNTTAPEVPRTWKSFPASPSACNVVTTGPCEARTNAHMSVRITNDTRKLMKTSMRSALFHRGTPGTR